MKINDLKTIYTSNLLVNCHILKGRLESDGVDCFIYDEHLIAVDPFYAVTIGGIKLKVPADQAKYAISVMESAKNGKLIDEQGEYELLNTMGNEFVKFNKILEVKQAIRKDPTQINNPEIFNTEWITDEDVLDIKTEENTFLDLTNRKFIFDWQQIWYHFFEFDKSVIQYFRIRPTEYYLDKEIVANYGYESALTKIILCPNCNSDNTKHGYAIDEKLDIWYLIFSFLIVIPFPLVRKNYHCFECGNGFK